ncbi:MAG: hypothetical protein WD314_10155 [Trueperaceae bacterium]
MLISSLLLASCTNTPSGTANACSSPSNTPLEDSNLATAVQNALELSAEPTCDDLEALTLLIARDQEIQSLQGLQYASNLTGLAVERNEIEDLSPLAELTSLEALHLDDNPIADITPVTGLTELDTLFLWNAQIEDFSVLAPLTKLQWVVLGGNPTSDISVVDNFPNLTFFGASDMGLTDLSVLEGKELTFLWVNHNPDLEDFSVIEDMTDLSALLAGGTGFDDGDMALLADKNLVRLQLWGNAGVTDLSVLEGMAMLSFELDIGGSGVVDLTPIQGLSELKQLRVYSLGLANADVDFLRDFSELELLIVDDNDLIDLGFLVDNAGIGEGDFVDVTGNSLDLNDPTVQQQIQALLDRGVDLQYEPQNE